jgi:hypothetical protein
LPQAPQFWGSDAAFTHCEPQAVCPAAQVTGPPVGLPLTFPSQPSSGSASGAIASAATIERTEDFIATTFPIGLCRTLSDFVGLASLRAACRPSGALVSRDGQNCIKLLGKIFDSLRFP